jgi:hypothetical protein
MLNKHKLQLLFFSKNKPWCIFEGFAGPGFSIGDVVPGDVLVGRRGVCFGPEITRQAEQT